MKIIILALIFTTCIVIEATPVSAPIFIQVENPSGYKFKIYSKGTAGQHWHETAAGYSVVKKDNIWYYAELSSGQLVASQKVVGITKSESLAISFIKHIKPEARAYSWNEIRKNNQVLNTALKTKGEIQTEFLPEQSNNLRTSNKLNTKAVTIQNMIVVEVSFSDIAITPANTTGDESIENAFFGVGKSVKDYYSKNFDGQFIIQPANESQGTVNDGVISITLNYAHPNFGDTFANADSMVIDVYNAIDPFLDLAPYDTNGDGNISTSELSIILIIAGYENSYGGDNSLTPRVWAHRGYITTQSYNTKTISDYTLGAEIHATAHENAHRFTIGVMAHELGHLMFGIPDLYDTDGSSKGVGKWGLMGGGSWNTNSGYTGIDPAYMLAWSKEVTGLDTSTVINSSGNYSLSGVGSAGGAYKIWLDKYQIGEHFHLENRQAVDYDTALPSEGLIISHANPTRPSNTDETNKRLDIEEADGLTHLDSDTNGGDDGDPFPGSSANANFNATSNPNSLMSDGTNTQLAISAITENGDNIDFTVQTSSIGAGDNISYVNGNLTGWGVGYGNSVAWTAVRFTNNSDLELLEGIEVFAREAGTVEIYIYQSMLSNVPVTELYHETTPVSVTAGWNRIILQTAQSFTTSTDLVLVLKITTSGNGLPVSFESGNDQGRSYLRSTGPGGTYILISTSRGEVNQRLLIGTPPALDTDNDGMEDDWEIANGLNPNDASDASSDSDSDGLTNLQEFNAGTNPQVADSDNDGMDDKYELDNDLDPLVDDSSLDADSDGLTNLEEFNVGTNPQVADTDSDGMGDKYELDNNLNPLVDDSSLDADSDGLTNIEEFNAGTNPQVADSDNDGMDDKYELDNNLNPLVDDSSLDADSDGLTNLEEFNAGTNPQSSDTDNDGLTDYEEAITYGTNPTQTDTDNDGMDDKYELDNDFNPLDASDCPSWMCGSSKIWMWNLLQPATQ